MIRYPNLPRRNWNTAGLRCNLPCRCSPRFCAQYIAAAAALCASGAVAQSFPAKPVRMVVPFAAGGGTDVIGRLVAQKLVEAWGQQVVVENRAGGGSVIGTEVVARSAPTGILCC